MQRLDLSPGKTFLPTTPQKRLANVVIVILCRTKSRSKTYISCERDPSKRLIPGEISSSAK